MSVFRLIRTLQKSGHTKIKQIEKLIKKSKKKKTFRVIFLIERKQKQNIHIYIHPQANKPTKVFTVT